MNEIIKMLTEPIENNFMGWFLIVLLWLLLVLLVGIIIYGILSAINYWFLPLKEGYGKIISMHFEPAHYSTILVYNAATKTSMPMTTWHPNAWKLTIEIDGLEDDFYLTKEGYVKHKIGEKIYVEYTNGRLWKSVDIKTAIV